MITNTTTLTKLHKRLACQWLVWSRLCHKTNIRETLPLRFLAPHEAQPDIFKQRIHWRTKYLLYVWAVATMLTVSWPLQCNAQCTSSAPAVSPVTVDDETSSTPLSRQLMPGFNTTINTSVPGQISIDAQTTAATNAATGLTTPLSPSVSTVGTTGSTTYQYAIVAKDSNGDACPFQLAGAITTGNSSLSSTNYNAISWTAVSGATSYDVYRIGSSLSSPVVGKLTNTTATSYNDQSNSTGDGTVPPSTTTTTITLTSASASTQILDCTNGNIIVNLPDATTCSGISFQFKRKDSTNNTAAIVGYSSQTVAQNQTTWTIFNKANPLFIQSDGSSQWRNMTEPSGNCWSVAALPPKKTRACTDFNSQSMVVRGNDGKIYGWGLSTNGNLADGNTSPSGLVVLNHPAAFDPNNPPATGTYIVDWAATGDNLYVVLSDGTVYAAGMNNYGQLGNNTTATTPTNFLQKITTFPSGTVISKVWAFDWGSEGSTSGYGKVFFLATTGQLYACGYNANNELGISTTTVHEPTLVPNIINPAQIKSAHADTAGFTLICDASGKLWVAGNNLGGQLGTGSTGAQSTFYTSSTLFPSNVLNVYPYGAYNGTAGTASSAVLDSSGVLWTAGLNTNGQLGVGNTTATNNDWHQVASTQETLQSSCVTYNAGTVSDTSGGTTVAGTSTGWTATTAPTSLQIAFGYTNPASVPSGSWHQIDSIASATSLTLSSAPGVISAGTSYVIISNPITQPITDFAWTGNGSDLGGVALGSGGGVWTWGYNGTDSLFYGTTTTPRPFPTQVPGVSSAQIIGATNTTKSATVQNSLFWDGSALHVAGTTAVGLIGQTDSAHTGAVVVSVPESIASGAETVSDVFVNNDSTTARLFILTDHGNLYATGDNTSDVSTGGITGPASVGLYKVGI